MMPNLVFLFFHFLISVASSLEKFSSWAKQSIEIDILEPREGAKSFLFLSNHFPKLPPFLAPKDTIKQLDSECS